MPDRLDVPVVFMFCVFFRSEMSVTQTEVKVIYFIYTCSFKEFWSFPECVILTFR